MSNIKSREIAEAMFGFGWFVKAPIIIAKLIHGNINSTMPSELKSYFKQLQAEAVTKAQIDSSSRTSYYKPFGYSTKAVRPNNATNLKIYSKSILETMIDEGFSYDHDAYATYQTKMQTLPKIIKSCKKLREHARLSYHKKLFSLKKALGDLRGSCQELSIVVALALASQSETKGLKKLSRKAEIQDKITHKDDLAFLNSFPADRSVKVLFGAMTDITTGQKEPHALVELSYTDSTTGNKETKVIDPAMILSQRAGAPTSSTP